MGLLNPEMNILTPSFPLSILALLSSNKTSTSLLPFKCWLTQFAHLRLILCLQWSKSSWVNYGNVYNREGTLLCLYSGWKVHLLSHETRWSDGFQNFKICYLKIVLLFMVHYCLDGLYANLPQWPSPFYTYQKIQKWIIHKVMKWEGDGCCVLQLYTFHVSKATTYSKGCANERCYFCFPWCRLSVLK